VVAACSSSGGSFVTGDGGKDGMTSPVPDAMADVNQSGSRLKAQFFAGSDGSRAFASMYDSQLKQPCTFTAASDGTNRCLPSGPAAIAATSYYGDSKCTQPIVSAPLGCSTAPPYASTFESSCSGTTTFHVYSRGAAFAPGANVYLGAGSSCTAVPTSGSSAFWFSVGAEIPPSMFVQGNLQTE
jgi:hypothetical protein